MMCRLSTFPSEVGEQVLSSLPIIFGVGRQQRAASVLYSLWGVGGSASFVFSLGWFHPLGLDVMRFCLLFGCVVVVERFRGGCIASILLLLSVVFLALRVLLGVFGCLCSFILVH